MQEGYGLAQKPCDAMGVSTLDLAQAAQFLRISEDALLRKARAGIVPGQRSGGGGCSSKPI
jgi:hypothetical protein